MRTCSHPADQLTLLFPAHDYITGHRFDIARCNNCGFTLTTPQPGREEMTAYYPAGYYGAQKANRFPTIVEKLQNALYVQRVKWVEKFNGGRRGQVLDVGCGRGLLLQEFQKRGWQIQGTELSEQAASYARQMLELPVEIGSLETIGFPDNKFDAVTLWHVLEHVPDPRTMLAEAHRVLKPGGVLLVGVPNFGSWEARLCRDKWFHLDVPRHLTHLTKPTLREALVQSGFQERAWSNFAPEYDVFSFVQSLLNRCGLRHNLLYNLLRNRRGKVITGEQSPAWQVAATVLLGVPLGLLSLPATVCAGLAGRAATMTVLAVKDRSTSA